jgi:predicted nuclease of predicted toxin-antitoxin system
LRVLLDESVPSDLKGLLVGHDVTTVQEHRWASKKNGELLALASAEFDVLVTADQGLPHQQNLAKFDIAVVVLVALSNRIDAYEAFIERIREAVASTPPGTAQRVTA